MVSVIESVYSCMYCNVGFMILTFYFVMFRESPIEESN
jgi:hypothetical protein